MMRNTLPVAPVQRFVVPRLFKKWCRLGLMAKAGKLASILGSDNASRCRVQPFNNRVGIVIYHATTDIPDTKSQSTNEQSPNEAT